MDYVELAKELRESAANKRLMIYAADAIEQLDKDLERSKEYEAFWEEEANEALRKFQVAVASKPRWIPVTERLPEYGTTVLVCGSQGGIYTARYERAKAEWDRDSWWKLNSKSHICNPTHWMPLPEPPKEETE